MNRQLPRWLTLSALLLLTACQRATLLEGLDERQANEVMAVLLESSIAAEKVQVGKQGYAVQVERSDLPAAIELVQIREVPSVARRHVDKSFAADALVSTPQAERARLFSAIEQRLEESISLMDGVASARVHVNYDAPGRQLGRDGDAPTHMSVLLVARAGIDEDVLIASVKRFLRNSFSQVSYEDISVVITPAAEVRMTRLTPQQPSVAGTHYGLAVAAVLLLAGAGMLAWRGFRHSSRRWLRRFSREAGE